MSIDDEAMIKILASLADDTELERRVAEFKGILYRLHGEPEEASRIDAIAADAEAESGNEYEIDRIGYPKDASPTEPSWPGAEALPGLGLRGSGRRSIFVRRRARRDRRGDSRRPTHEGVPFHINGLKFLPGLLTGVGALAAVAILGGFSRSTTDLLLRLYAVGIFLIIVLWGLGQFFRTRSKERDRRLEELIAEVKDRKADLAEIAARQAATHTEELIVTITVGRTDAEDHVREEAQMTPKPLVVYKPVRPIVPTTDLDKPIRYEDMNIQVGVDEGDDGQVHVQVTPLEAKPGVLSLGLLFRPDLTKPTNWWMEYTSPGLFAPFRKSGRDQIVWNNYMRNDPEGKSPLTSLEFRFVFLDLACNPNVKESGGLGTLVSRSRNEKGQWVVRWRDPSPGRHRYEWWVTGRPVPEVGAAPLRRRLAGRRRSYIQVGVPERTRGSMP